jgi:hypothetical protein
VIVSDLRDAVIADLTSAGAGYFGPLWTVAPIARWYESIQQSDGPLRIAVIADAQRTERTARGYLQVDCDLIVHATAKLSQPANDLEETDDLTEILEKIERYYYVQALRVSTTPATMTATETQLPSRKQLREHARWYAWCRLTFRLLDRI